MRNDPSKRLWSLMCDLWLPYKDLPKHPGSGRSEGGRRGIVAVRSPIYSDHLGRPRYRHRKTRAHNLYENEERSDVVFFVGDDTFKERIPAHSWVLSARNHFFKAMFHETWADRHKKVYNIPNDPKGFQNLLKWLYRRECTFQSPESALTTLHVAIQYLCPELADLCAAYISQQLTDSNVLRVLQQIYQYCPGPFLSPPTAPSAPSLDVLEGHGEEALRTIAQDLGEETDLRNPTECCSDLFNECLELLDRDACPALESEYLEELDHEALGVVLKRGTLGIPDEIEVVRAVVRWSTAQCKRRNLPLTPLNRRQMLGDLLYSLRLLKLTPDKVSECAKFLDKEEFEFIQADVCGKVRKGLCPPSSLAPYLKLMATARGPLPTHTAPPEPPQSSKKKCGKRKYTKKELLLDIVSFLAIIFD